jgi:hypothetical protein
VSNLLKVEGDLYIQSNLPEGGGGSLYTVKPALRGRGDLYIQLNLPYGVGISLSLHLKAGLTVYRDSPPP